MGATTFTDLSRSPTSDSAFESLVQEAQYQYGHNGYTGTIAEKHTFTMASETPLKMQNAYDLAHSLLDTEYNSKWGPAGCIEIISEPKSKDQTDKLFLFFGWASE